MRMEPMGERAAMVWSPQVVALYRQLAADPLPHQDELIPGAETLLITFDRRSHVAAGLAALRARQTADAGAGEESASGAATDTRVPAGELVTISAVYAGADLADVAEYLGMSPQAVIDAHTSAAWQVAFCGFSPGFAYLTCDNNQLVVPRHASPRPNIPTGSVGLAGAYSGIYPQSSPGGWQLIAHTDAPLWELDRDPPALLTPGARVRFVAARESMTCPGPVPIRAAGAGVDDPSTFTPLVSALAASGAVVKDAAGERPATSGAAPPPIAPASPSGAVPSTSPAPSLSPGLPAVSALLVTRPAAQLLIQDAGRPGFAHLGVSPSGAADQGALRAANQLVGNLPTAAGLEIVLGGAEFQAIGDLTVAVTGAPVSLRLIPAPAPHPAVGRAPGAELVPQLNQPFEVPTGVRLRLGRPHAGLRTYLAVAGGIDASPVFGSRSTDTLSGLGPAAVQRGDLLPIGPLPTRTLASPGPAPTVDSPHHTDSVKASTAQENTDHGSAAASTIPDLAASASVADSTAAGSGNQRPVRAPSDTSGGNVCRAAPRESTPADSTPAGDSARIAAAHNPEPVAGGSPAPVVLTATPGPQYDDLRRYLDPHTGWTVSPLSNRTAVRLEPPTVPGHVINKKPTPDATATLSSQPLIRGAIQATPSGELVIFLADYPVTGGYSVPAILTERAADMAAQVRPGMRVRLEVEAAAECEADEGGSGA